MSSSGPTIILKTPGAVSALCFANTSFFASGAADGSIRFYDLPEIKVQKAVRRLGSEISSLAFSPRSAGVIWAAAGREILCFDLSSFISIMDVQHAAKVITVFQEEDEVLNEIALNSTHLAFSSDSGRVGVVDLHSYHVTFMAGVHANIAGSISFIPDRPQEIVSGGYDSNLIHHNFQLANVLSRFELDAGAKEPGSVSMAPPFVLCLSVSSAGVIAAGTADGRLWVGNGGLKDGRKSGKSRKWGGLKASEGSYLPIAQGPIVAVTFKYPATILSATLSGTVLVSEVPYTDGARPMKETEHITKVNAISISADGKWLVVGGIGKQGEGYAECWPMD